MRFACWITKATDTHSEYVILTALASLTPTKFAHPPVLRMCVCHTRRQNNGATTRDEEKQ